MRCLTCGRRWQGSHTSCQATSSSEEPGLPGDAWQPRCPAPFELVCELGRGGFGVVLSARSPDGQRVAIKLARRDQADAVRRLEQEIEALRLLGPPATPRVIAEGTTPEGDRYVVMEQLELATLAVRLAAVEEGLALHDFRRLALALADAVAVVHARGLVHRDLKPENVFVHEDLSAVRLIDFGLVRASARVGDGLTREGDVIGTADYMAPEQCRGERGVDQRADVYALGVMLYEAWTARPPFFGKPAEVQQAHVTLRPRPLRALRPTPDGLEEVVLTCLQKRRDRRYADAGALADALRAVFAGSLAAAAAPTAAPRAPARREQRVVGLLFVCTTDTATVQSVGAALGGQLAHLRDSRLAVAFLPGGGEPPVRRALRALEELMARRVCAAGILDVAPVAVTTRADGSLRFSSPLLTREDRYPPPEASGALVTDGAAGVLGDLRFQPVAGRDDLQAVLASGGSDAERTTLPPLVGRDHEVGALLESARRALSGGVPTLVTLLAGAGLGKSHLCAAVAGAIAEAVPDAQVLALRARAPVGERSDTLGALLRWALGLASEQAPQRDRRLLEERLGPAAAVELWPSFLLALGWARPDDPEVEAFAAAPGALRAGTIRLARLALAERLAHGPVAIVLDDGHLADDLLLAVLEQAVAEAPLWILVAARDELEAARPDWGALAPRRERIALAPLSDADSDRLCRILLEPARDVPASAVRRLVERSLGVPLLLTELVRGLRREGLLRRHPGSEVWYVATDQIDQLPDLPLVGWLAEREVRALPDELVSHARVAALLGADFDAEELDGVVAELDRAGGGEAVPLDAEVGLARLTAIGLLVAARDGRFAFRHPLLREAVATTLPPELRAAVHAAALRYHDRARHDLHPDRLARIAMHAAATGDRQRAAETFATLAEAAQARHEYLQAEALYSRALEHIEAAAHRLAAQRGRGLVRYRLGRYHDALTDLEAALATARALANAEAEIDVLLDLGTACDWIDEWGRSRELVERAAELAGPDPPAALAARLALGTGRSLWRFNRWTEAEPDLRRAAAAAAGLGPAGYETLVVALLLLGHLLSQHGSPDQVADIFGRLEELCRSHGDGLHLAATLNNRRHLWIARKEPQRAIDDLVEVIRIGRDLGISGFEYGAYINLAEIHYQLGEATDAALHAERGLEWERRRAGAGGTGRPLAALMRLRILHYEQRFAEAAALLSELRSEQDQARREGRSELLFVPEEQVLLEMVQLAVEEAGPAAWDALLERSRRYSVDFEPLEVLEARARAAHRRGAHAEASEAMAEARALAGRIPNLMDRRLENTWLEIEAGGDSVPLAAERSRCETVNRGARPPVC